MPVPTISDIAATLATLAPDTVLSHRTAGQLWGLWLPPYEGFEVTTPADLRPSRYTTGVQRHTITAHRRVLPASEIAEVAGLPVTTLERTWLDLAPLLSVLDLIAAGDSAVRAGADAEVLAGQLAGITRRRGIVRARTAVPLLDGRSRSRPESRIRGALVLAGLPKPRVNQPIYDEHGGWLAEPDLAYDEAKLVIEYNGRGHEEEPGRMERDAIRALDLERADWTVRVYTAVHAFRRLDEVVADTRRHLERYAPQLLTAAPLARRVTYSHDQRRRNHRL